MMRDLNDYPLPSGLVYDQRSGVLRREHGRTLVCHRFSGSSATTSSSSTQQTATTGSGQTAQGGVLNRTVGGALTEIQNKLSNFNSGNSTSNSGNKISADGDVNYQTYVTGLTGNDLSTLVSSLAGSTGKTGTSGANPFGGQTVYNTPPTAQANNDTNASAITSTVKWGLAAAAVAVVGIVWVLFNRKKS